LKLEDARHNNNNSLYPGEIIVRFWTEETASAGSAAVVAAQQAVINNLESGSSAMKSLETVVSKLKLFAEIANEAAQVQYIIHSNQCRLTCSFIVQIHPYVNFVWTATSALYTV